jgi:hypothetical protein
MPEGAGGEEFRLLTVAVQDELSPTISGDGLQTRTTEVPRKPLEAKCDVETDVLVVPDWESLSTSP